MHDGDASWQQLQLLLESVGLLALFPIMQQAGLDLRRLQTMSDLPRRLAALGISRSDAQIIADALVAPPYSPPQMGPKSLIMLAPHHSPLQQHGQLLYYQIQVPAIALQQPPQLQPQQQLLLLQQQQLQQQQLQQQQLQQQRLHQQLQHQQLLEHQQLQVIQQQQAVIQQQQHELRQQVQLAPLLVLEEQQTAIQQQHELLQLVQLAPTRRSRSRHSSDVPFGPPAPTTTAGAFETVFINLDARTDRRASMERRLSAAGIQLVSRLAAARGADTPDVYVAREWDSSLNAKYDLNCKPTVGLKFSTGERGCAMSHALLWERVARRASAGLPLLVLEDDVLLSKDANQLATHLVAQVEQTMPPDDRNILLYLGAHVAKWLPGGDQRPEAAVQLREAEWLWQTHAYIVWPVAAQCLLEGLPIDAPVDNYISRNVLERKVRAFVCQPELATQEAPYANGDVVHSSLSKDSTPAVSRSGLRSTSQRKRRS